MLTKTIRASSQLQKVEDQNIPLVIENTKEGSFVSTSTLNKEDELIKK